MRNHELIAAIQSGLDSGADETDWDAPEFEMARKLTGQYGCVLGLRRLAKRFSLHRIRDAWRGPVSRRSAIHRIERIQGAVMTNDRFNEIKAKLDAAFAADEQLKMESGWKGRDMFADIFEFPTPNYDAAENEFRASGELDTFWEIHPEVGARRYA